MHPRLLMWLVVGLLACGGSTDHAQSDLDPATQLVGAWEMRLVQPGAPDVRGVLTLAPTTFSPPAGSEARAAGEFRGTFALKELGSLPHPAADSIAEALLERDGSVALQLHVVGDCSDCGNLNLYGKLDGNRIRGRWSREFLQDEPGGTFLLRRAR
jgi:hypothetical protein